MSATARRAIGLVRVSKEKDGGTSPEVQRHAIEAYARARGYQVVDWVEGVEEAKYSGSRRNSAWWPMLDSAIGRVEADDADVLIVWKFSRTARHRLRWAVALDRVDVAGGSIESATEQTDATPSGRFARGMLGEINAYQAELIGETWREAHERRRRAGLTPSGGPRFGYQPVRDDQGRTMAYSVDPVTGPVLADMYMWFLQGAGLTAIARRLNAGGYPTRTGKPWTRVTVTQVLDAGFGAGLLASVGVGVSAKRNYMPGAHEPVIDEPIWAAYVARRSTADPASRGLRGGYLLSGIVYCGDCESRMHGSPVDRRPHYICSRGHVQADVTKVCMRADLAEKVVFDWLVAEGKEDIHERNRASEQRERARTRVEAQARTTQAELEKVKKALVDMTVAYYSGSGPVDPETYEQTAAKLREDRDRFQAKLAAATPNPVESITRAAIPKDLDAAWPNMSMEERVEVVRPLIRRVWIDRPTRPGKGVWKERVTVESFWDEERKPRPGG